MWRLPASLLYIHTHLEACDDIYIHFLTFSTLYSESVVKIISSFISNGQLGWFLPWEPPPPPPPPQTFLVTCNFPACITDHRESFQRWCKVLSRVRWSHQLPPLNWLCCVWLDWRPGQIILGGIRDVRADNQERLWSLSLYLHLSSSPSFYLYLHLSPSLYLCPLSHSLHLIPWNTQTSQLTDIWLFHLWSFICASGPSVINRLWSSKISHKIW